jgi:hypothetical protein
MMISKFWNFLTQQQVAGDGIACLGKFVTRFAVARNALGAVAEAVLAKALR